jgi:hypothetical protein
MAKLQGAVIGAVKKEDQRSAIAMQLFHSPIDRAYRRYLGA